MGRTSHTSPGELRVLPSTQHRHMQLLRIYWLGLDCEDYMADSGFPGESFLSEPLPDYASERMMLLVKLILAFVFWMVVLPAMMTREIQVPAEAPDKKVIVVKEGEKSRSKKGPKRQNKGKPTEEKVEEDVKEVETIRELDAFSSMVSVLGCVACLAYVMITASPDNYYTTRGVFEAPLFTREECNFLVDMAENVARRNYEAAQNVTLAAQMQGKEPNATIRDLLKNPEGWQKKRHEAYPTTDLNLVLDPFAKDDWDWIQTKLDARLSPFLQRLFGIPAASVRAYDMFVIRYDGDRQAQLTPHTDSGDVTFAALLSDDFEEGGTRYWNRNTEEPIADVLPNVGQMTVFPGLILHEGLQISKGRRYLLIGFLGVDRWDPFTGDWTGMSWFASWGSLNWASRRFADGYEAAVRNLEWGDITWTTPKHVRGFFLHLMELIQDISDYMCRHHFTVLVDNSKTDEYLEALDNAHATQGTANSPKPSSWFAGQQVILDVDGTINSYWTSRLGRSERFEEQVS